MKIDDKIRDKKLKYKLIEKQRKFLHYYLTKLRNMNVLQVNKYYLPITAK